MREQNLPACGVMRGAVWLLMAVSLGRVVTSCPAVYSITFVLRLLAHARLLDVWICFSVVLFVAAWRWLARWPPGVSCISREGNA